MSVTRTEGLIAFDAVLLALMLSSTPTHSVRQGCSPQHGPGFTLCIPPTWKRRNDGAVFGKLSGWSGPEGSIFWRAGPFGESFSERGDLTDAEGTFGRDYSGPPFQQRVLGGRLAHVLGDSVGSLRVSVEWLGLRMWVTAAEPQHLPRMWQLLSGIQFDDVNTGQACAVTLSKNLAVFLFPALTTSAWPIHQSRNDPQQTTVEYWWAVSWDAPQVPGIGKRELSLIHRWEDANKPARLSLRELVRQSSREVLDERSRSVGDEAVAAARDPAFSTRVDQGRLRFELSGHNAIARYFATHPDSVVFSFERMGIREIDCTAPVRYP